MDQVEGAAGQRGAIGTAFHCLFVCCCFFVSFNRQKVALSELSTAVTAQSAAARQFPETLF